MRVAHGDVLPLRHDLVRRVDVAPDEVLQLVVRVEAAATLAELCDPGPHRGGRGGDGHRARRDEVGLRDEGVTGELGVELAVHVVLPEQRPETHPQL